MTSEDTYSELIENSRVLYKLGLSDREYSDLETVFEWLECAAKVDEAYKKAGITFVSKFSKWNKLLPRERDHLFRGAAHRRTKGQKEHCSYACRTCCLLIDTLLL